MGMDFTKRTETYFTLIYKLMSLKDVLQLLLLQSLLSKLITKYEKRGIFQNNRLVNKHCKCSRQLQRDC